MKSSKARALRIRSCKGEKKEERIQKTVDRIKKHKEGRVEWWKNGIKEREFWN